MRVVAVLLLFAIVASGCMSPKTSTGDMRAAVEEAIKAFPSDVGPTGTLSSIKVEGDVGMETMFNNVPVTVTIQPKMTVHLGAEGDVLVTGKALAMTFSGYCSQDIIIAIVEGGEEYGMPDTSAEARNPLGICTGRGSEALLAPYFDFPMIDPALLTGDLRLENMEEQGFDDLGKGKYAGMYEVKGDNGTTTLTITAKGGHIQRIVSQNPNAHLKLDMTYAERDLVEVPEADHRVPSFVTGSTKRDENGWTWTGTAVEGGPASEYTIHVYPEATSSGCTAPANPTVSFDLGDGIDQRKEGWRLTYFDDGDGTLGKGDTIVLQQPSAFTQAFDHVVIINDDWAGKKASWGCSVPGPTPVFGLLSLLGAVLVARRR